MAQNVSIAGADYPAVPYLLIPITNGGGSNAKFVDVSDTTAAAADVASGKYFYTSAGVKTAGTSSGGGGDDYKAFISRSTTTPTLPSGLTSISAYACYSWSALTSPNLPDSITDIGAYAFYNCANLNLASLPSSLTTIGTYAFYSCTNLALTSLSSGLTSIGTNAFYSCTNLALTSLSSGLTSIGSNAFNGCTGLTAISCDGALGTSGMGNGAFNRCSNLASARFPNMTQTSLGTVFGYSASSYACQKLELADIGKTSGIAANAFANCNKLQTLILRKTDSICTLANVSAFTSTPMRGYNSLTGTVYVPSALISTYNTASNWKTLYDAGTVTFSAIEGSQYEL